MSNYSEVNDWHTKAQANKLPKITDTKCMVKIQFEP